MGSWTRGILAFCGVTGLGYGLLKLTTPSRDQLYEVKAIFYILNQTNINNFRNYQTHKRPM
jgi:hypothetical protein